MKRDPDLTYVNLLLAATAFAAGAVDIIGFARLGGVFASAMTGNFALLTYHLAQANFASAVGSVVALAGFVFGCVCGFTLRRDRSPRAALRLLLCLELGLLFVFAVLALAAGTGGPGHGQVPPDLAIARVQIALLALSMGLQAVVGQSVSLSTIVFTTTLTRMVGGIVDYFARVRSPAEQSIGIQTAVVSAYLCGALLAGVLALHGIAAAVFLPLVGVTVAASLVALPARQA
jgi:uncharacterized membrane protein YoaK (UPF0700 family)